MRVAFEEFNHRSGGDAEIDGDGGGVALQRVEQVEQQACDGGIKRVTMRGFDFILAADGEEPFGRLEMREIDRLANFAGEFQAEAMNGAFFVFE